MFNTNIRDLMIRSSTSLSENAISSFEENSKEISEMMLSLEMLDIWVSRLNTFEQNAILKEVCYDLLSSIYISAQGMYRNAYISLRSAIELGLSFIYFVDRNFEYLLWKINDYDMKWSVLKDENEGILSKRYLSLFLGEQDVEELIQDIKNAYRQCSEYVHGKYKFMHTIDEQKIPYQKDKFICWSSMFLDVAKLMNILLTIRFPSIANSFAEDKKMSLKDMLVDYRLGGLIY